MSDLAKTVAINRSRIELLECGLGNINHKVQSLNESIININVSSQNQLVNYPTPHSDMVKTEQDKLYSIIFDNTYIFNVGTGYQLDLETTHNKRDNFLGISSLCTGLKKLQYVGTKRNIILQNPIGLELGNYSTNWHLKYIYKITHFIEDYESDQDTNTFDFSKCVHLKFLNIYTLYIPFKIPPTNSIHQIILSQDSQIDEIEYEGDLPLDKLQITNIKTLNIKSFNFSKSNSKITEIETFLDDNQYIQKIYINQTQKINSLFTTSIPNDPKSDLNIKYKVITTTNEPIVINILITTYFPNYIINIPIDQKLFNDGDDLNLNQNYLELFYGEEYIIQSENNTKSPTLTTKFKYNHNIENYHGFIIMYKNKITFDVKNKCRPLILNTNQQYNQLYNIPIIMEDSKLFLNDIIFRKTFKKLTFTFNEDVQQFFEKTIDISDGLLNINIKFNDDKITLTNNDKEIILDAITGMPENISVTTINNKIITLFRDYFKNESLFIKFCTNSNNHVEINGGLYFMQNSIDENNIHLLNFPLFADSNYIKNENYNKILINKGVFVNHPFIKSEILELYFKKTNTSPGILTNKDVEGMDENLNIYYYVNTNKDGDGDLLKYHLLMVLYNKNTKLILNYWFSTFYPNVIIKPKSKITYQLIKTNSTLNSYKIYNTNYEIKSNFTTGNIFSSYILISKINI